jgi:hypothetical protein
MLPLHLDLLLHVAVAFHCVLLPVQCPTPGAITSCDLALSGDLLGCSDGLGVVHFFASSSSAACNAYSAPHSLPHVGPFIGPNAIKSEAADVVAQPAKDVSAAFIECSFVSAPPFDAALDSQGPPVPEQTTV